MYFQDYKITKNYALISQTSQLTKLNIVKQQVSYTKNKFARFGNIQIKKILTRICCFLYGTLE